MTEQEKIKIYNNAINQFGIINQQFMLVEECAELLNALAKSKRSRAGRNDIIQELADVSIMVEQMAYFYSLDDYKMVREQKLERLKIRLEEGGAL